MSAEGRTTNERRRAMSSLPAELRPHRESIVFWIAAYVGAIVIGALLGSPVARLLLPVVVSATFAVIYLRRESRQRAAVIRSVQARAPSMSRSELESLVGTLETAYTAKQMSALRKLLRA